MRACNRLKLVFNSQKRMLLRYLQIILFVVLTVFAAKAQTKNDTISYSLNSRIMAGNGTYASFLSTANQYDQFCFAPNSLTIWGMLHKNVNRLKELDYGFGM